MTDGADALLRAAEQRPDVVVADFTLPGLDGLRLLEKLRSRPSTREVGFVLMAPRRDLDQIPRRARELADELVEKPFLIGDAMTAIRRVIARTELQRALRFNAADATGTGAGAGRMRGSLSLLSLVDLLQALELGGKTCRLLVEYEKNKFDVFVERGAVVYAACGKKQGDEAVFEALTWPEGDFELDFTAASAPKHNVERSTQSLLMDGLRILDEARHAAGEDVLGNL
jgi:CheY-like chemotaxis protein